MSQPERFETLVLGSGEGGKYLAWHMARSGRRAAVVERRWIGSRVTIIQHGSQLMDREDPDVAEELRRILSDEGIQVLLAAKTLRVQGRSGEEVSLLVRTPSGEQTIGGSDILVAAGRSPNTAGIGLEVAGVELDGRGYIRVNERLETSSSGVWASGDAPAAPSSRTSPSTTFGSFGIIWPERSAPRATDWSPTACSRTRHSRAWG